MGGSLTTAARTTSPLYASARCFLLALVSAALLGLALFTAQPAHGHDFGTPSGNVGDHFSGQPNCEAYSVFGTPGRGVGEIFGEVSDTFRLGSLLRRAFIKPAPGFPGGQWVRASIWVNDLNDGTYPYGPLNVGPFFADEVPDVPKPYSFLVRPGSYRVLFLFQWWDENRGGWNSGYDWHFARFIAGNYLQSYKIGPLFSRVGHSRCDIN